ncbi:hypothetical protein BU16DRAFT_554533 [Lophium mytilinum]|uniref:Uncharacterized protein n=1 Tax=Lophium mytilinum TaxID=390894 RepID=A0A6A6RC84_9PEZI|nr:hypothetical protein BU16DRAFT_554533 [Lophium mytilinum]
MLAPTRGRALNTPALSTGANHNNEPSVVAAAGHRGVRPRRLDQAERWMPAPWLTPPSPPRPIRSTAIAQLLGPHNAAAITASRASDAAGACANHGVGNMQTDRTSGPLVSWPCRIKPATKPACEFDSSDLLLIREIHFVSFVRRWASGVDAASI